jgi:hypothetical protein
MFERLERIAVKVARSVLRGERGSNAPDLPDKNEKCCILKIDIKKEDV